jgi:hypothetical protein
VTIATSLNIYLRTILRSNSQNVRYVPHPVDYVLDVLTTFDPQELDTPGDIVPVHPGRE